MLRTDCKQCHCYRHYRNRRFIKAHGYQAFLDVSDLLFPKNSACFVREREPFTPVLPWCLMSIEDAAKYRFDLGIDLAGPPPPKAPPPAVKAQPKPKPPVPVPHVRFAEDPQSVGQSSGASPSLPPLEFRVSSGGSAKKLPHGMRKKNSDIDRWNLAIGHVASHWVDSSDERRKC